jgi:G protein-coupled receptor GPR1
MDEPDPYVVSLNGSTSGLALKNGTAAPITITILSLYTDSEKRTLRIIAMTFASFSLLAGALMLYWYIRLPKKTFRHTYISLWFDPYASLILGLIGSDMLRSTLELAYPIVTLSRGDVSVGSLYCDIGGFFTAYFFEATDLMIFIIAIHTAVYVFNPKLTRSGDEGGLWRWRYYVFAIWLSIPALLGGLAFINPISYAPLVTWCYIPARPLVWRYTLAWGPRYFILLTISVLYVALYIYVRRVYRKIDRSQRNSGSTDSELDTTRGSVSSQGQSTQPNSAPQVPHPSYLNRKRPSIPPPLVEEDEKDSRPSTAPSDADTPSPTSASSILHNHQPVKPDLNLLSPPLSTNLRNMSVTTTLAESLPPSLRDPPPGTDSTPQSFDNRRARVERQMRTLFIFPIVYFIMWIPPFINHLYQVVTYDASATQLPSGTFVVTLLATIFLPAQGLVNVCVYAIRERPWRRRRRKERLSTASTSRVGRVASSLSEWKGFHNEEKAAEQARAEDLQAQIHQAKLTHLRSANTAQAAYARRDVERGEKELARANTMDPRPRRANWWDTQDDIEANRM